AYVSNGRLPAGERVQALVTAAYERFRTNSDGHTSTVYPALARVPPELFGICVTDTSGRSAAAGDADVEFAIMSVAKPFVFAVVCQALGPELTRRTIGVNATGRPFNSLGAVEQRPGGLTNPMVNSGAIVTSSLTPGRDVAEQWHHLVDGLSRFAGRELTLDEEMYASAADTNQRNRSLALLLQSVGGLTADPVAAVDLYTRQSCLRVTARDLAVMGATLADGGLNPITQDQVVDPETCGRTLAVMATAGLYETSGDWLFTIGLPGKSGIGGGIVTAAPGKGGLGTYAPLLDPVGNSVKGQLTAAYLSEELGLNLFSSAPVAPDRG
ncbi:MAG: glutaminase A, partial [Propionibacteriaceae bacterium]